jgi:hypothetical protein
MGDERWRSRCGAAPESDMRSHAALRASARAPGGASAVMSSTAPANLYCSLLLGKYQHTSAAAPAAKSFTCDSRDDEQQQQLDRQSKRECALQCRQHWQGRIVLRPGFVTLPAVAMFPASCISPVRICYHCMRHGCIEQCVGRHTCASQRALLLRRSVTKVR